MADVELVIKIPEELYQLYKGRPPMLGDAGMDMIAQAIANGSPLLSRGHSGYKPNEEVFDMAIKALEQEPCEDAVSRYDAVRIVQHNNPPKAIQKLRNLPPVTPKGVTLTDFADKCRECGKQEKSEWVFEKTKFDKYGCTVKCPSCHKKWKTYDEIRWKKENKFCPNCGIKMEDKE